MNEEQLIKKYVPINKQKKAFKLLKKNYPVQYIIGNVDFYNNKILVNRNVLIPRFETELLVDKTINYIHDMFDDKKINIADLGTGSGAIAIAIKKNTNCNMYAYDISNKALKVAKKNAKLSNVDINFKRKNILKSIEGKYDCIISNPPYIKRGDKIAKPVEYEPEIALYADNDGLEFYEKIFEYAKKNLNKKYLLAFEFGDSEDKEILIIAKKEFPKANITIEKDLAGKNRFLFIKSE